MTYQSTVEMAASQSLQARIVAAAAAEDIPEPLQWVQTHLWHIVSEPGWGDAWDYAKGTENDDVNPDTGKRPGVIGDPMILSAVQAVRAAETAPPPA